MAEQIKEEILIDITIEKEDNEKQVDNLTKKITALTKATQDLKKENNELIKNGQENTQQYIDNTKQIEINKQKINEATSSRKNLINTLISEDDSIKGLNARNAELIKQRNLLSTSTNEGRQKIQEINQELDKNNKAIQENVSGLEKQKINIGNYKSALDGIVPGLGGFIDGIEKGTKAALVFIATPLGAILGAIGLALGALTAYFKGSEEGQNRLNKIVAVGSAILEQFKNVVEDVGKFLFEAFSNPKQAAIDFVDFLKDQVINRFVGLLELIPKLGQSIELLFAGKFAEAGKVAGDAVGKVVLGIEHATDKIAGFIDSTIDLVNQGIENGEKLAALNAKIDADERKLIVDREKTNLEVQKIRAEALELEGEARKKTLGEAIKLQEELSARETEFAKARLARAELEVKSNGDDKEALKALAEARAAVFAAEATTFSNTLKLKKEVEAIDKQIAADKEKRDQEAIKEAKDTAKAIADAEKEQFDTNLELLKLQQEEKANALKESYLQQLISKDEFEKQFTNLEFESLEGRKAFLIANKQSVTDIEAEMLDKQIKNKENAAAKEATIEKKRLDNEKNIVNSKIGLASQLGNFLQQIAGKNKAIAIAGIIIQKAAAIAQIIAQTAIANANAIATFWLTGGLPWTAINTAQAVLSIASVVGEAATSISAINSAATGTIVRKIPKRGGVLRGPSHARGGIPLIAEGDEAVINKRSTQMFRGELSRINQAGGGVPFATGGIVGTQTRAASIQAESASSQRDLLMSAVRALGPIIVTVEDINARQSEVSEQTNKAMVI